MSYCSTGTSSSHNNRMEGEVLGSRPIGCVCNLKKKKKSIYPPQNIFSLFPSVLPNPPPPLPPLFLLFWVIARVLIQGSKNPGR